MLERQREGIAKARVEGRYTGRKPTVRNQAETIRAMMADGDGPSVIAPQTQGRALVGLRSTEGLTV
jgi:DNA invertase Pin-like site-specific DNA recombinase